MSPNDFAINPMNALSVSLDLLSLGSVRSKKTGTTTDFLVQELEILFAISIAALVLPNPPSPCMTTSWLLSPVKQETM